MNVIGRNSTQTVTTFGLINFLRDDVHNTLILFLNDSKYVTVERKETHRKINRFAN